MYYQILLAFKLYRFAQKLMKAPRRRRTRRSLV